MSDSPFSSLIKLMREEGQHNNAPSFYLGKVTGVNQVLTNGITLYKDDLYRNKDISIVTGDEVLLIEIGEKFIIVCKVVNL